MKKNFKFMLVALLALFGFNNAFAADLAVDQVINDNAYYYKIKSVTTTGTNRTGTVYIQKINTAKTGEIILPPQFELTHEGKTYTFTVIGIEDGTPETAAFKDQTGLTKVTIGSTYEYIGSNAFYGCTNLATIDLSGAKGLTTIADQAFVTIQVKSYDFSACTKLTGFLGMPFVENIENKNNSYVEAIILPTSSSFKTIGIALSRLPNLENLNIANSKVNAIVADAFKGDAKLKSMTLPGTVKTIASNAFRGSSVETLVIDATSIQAIGSNNGEPVYGDNADNKDILKSLTITGELKGIIEENAFSGESKLETLALDCTFGTTGQVQTGAFAQLGNKITKVTLGDITDNGKNDYTIQGGAFTGNKLTEVEIGDITAPLAIGPVAFGTWGDKPTGITKVTIGDIKTSAIAIAAEAFVFADANCTLTIGDVRSTNATTPVMDAGAFSFVNVQKVDKGNPVNTVTVTIGAVEAKGNNFKNASITSPTNAKSFTLTFDGDIEQHAFLMTPDAGTLLSNNSKLNNLTFKGKVAEEGITAGAFAGLANKAVVTFEESLAENAVMNGAFTLTANGENNNELTVKYTGTPDDATVNPFQQKAFLAAQLGADKKRSVTLTISDPDLKDLIAGKQISIDKPAGKDPANDIIYAVILINKEVIAPTTLTVYQKTGTTNSYGRWYITPEEFPQGLVIKRRGNDDVDGTLTLYTTYVEDDATNKVVVINMQPIVSTDGKYYISAAQLAAGAVEAGWNINFKSYASGDADAAQWATGTAKAVAVEGAANIYKITVLTNSVDGFEGNDYYVQYAGGTDAANDIKTQLFTDAECTTGPTGIYVTWETPEVVEPYAGNGLVIIAKATGTSLEETEIVWTPNTDGKESAFYTDYAVQVSPVVVTNEQLRDGSGAVTVAANQDLFFITNPAKHNGITAPTYDFRKASNIYIDNGSFYLLATKYINANAARIVWLDGSEEVTGIENVKTVNAEGAIFNLAGQQVDANYKGIVIKGGKKMIQK